MVVALAIALVASSQQVSDSFPRFQNYPVSEILSGKPALPKLVRPGDRVFRTRIHDGAAKGPNFAGHYTIVEWGCGSSCVSIVVVDAVTGEVFSAPFRILGYGRVLKYADVSAPIDQPLEYRLKSRLLIVRGCPEDQNCASYFYEWERPSFKLIRKAVAVPIPH